jgi:high affinity sulfate transporter 1
MTKQATELAVDRYGHEKDKAQHEEHEKERRAAAAVVVPPKGRLVDELRAALKETFFPENPIASLRKLRTPRERFFSVIAYIFPVFHWARGYNLLSLKDDIIAGLTIGSLCIPQDIAYAKLAGVPPIYGLCKLCLPFLHLNQVNNPSIDRTTRSS